jgi:2-phosphosulfolactate phosphatase
VFYDQSDYDVRCEWGLGGVERLSGNASAVVVVDVLSFTTSVDIAVSRGAAVFPYRWGRDNADALSAFARERDAVLPGEHRGQGFSLSPASLLAIQPGQRLVLPSPNGSTLSMAVEDRPVLAGCLRNAAAVARAACKYGPGVLVVPAGERWPDSTLRPSIEDLIGAGAIISHLPGRLSPEASVALAAFQYAKADLTGVLRQCSSGRELIERGFAEDVELAAELDASSAVPRLVDGAYHDVSTASG